MLMAQAASEAQTHHGYDEGVLDEPESEPEQPWGQESPQGLGQPLEGLPEQGWVQVPGRLGRLEGVLQALELGSENCIQQEKQEPQLPQETSF